MKIRPIIRSLTAAILLGAGLCVGASSAQRSWTEDEIDNAERCLLFMLAGPKYDGITIHGEGFDCWQSKFSEGPSLGGNKGIKFQGQISHRLAYRSDDEIYFWVVIDGGHTPEVHTLLKNGGLGAAVLPSETDSIGLQDSAAYYRPEDPRELVRMMLAQAKSYGYEETAHAIIKAYAWAMWRSMQMADPPKMAFYVGRPGPDLRSIDLQSGKTYGPVKIDKRYPRDFFNACAALCTQENACQVWTVIEHKTCHLKGAGTHPVLGTSSTVTGVKSMTHAPITSKRPEATQH